MRNGGLWEVADGAWGSIRRGDRVVVLIEDGRVTIAKPGAPVHAPLEAGETRADTNPINALVSLQNKSAGLNLTLLSKGDASPELIAEARQPAAVEALSDVVVACPACGAEQALPGARTEYGCPGCGETVLLRGCPDCASQVHVPVSLAGSTLVCPSCGHHNSYSSWAGLFVRAAELGQRSAKAEPDPDRRTVAGIVITATGLAPIPGGAGCLLEFGRDGVGITVSTVAGTVEAVSIPWDEIREIEVTGPGAITTTTGGGFIGGGFGIGGFVEGALLARAFNAMTEKTTTTIETIVRVNAGGRALLLLDRTITPEVLRVRLAPSFARMEDARRVDGRANGEGSRLRNLKLLGELLERGTLSLEEFEAEKARTLAGA